MRKYVSGDTMIRLKDLREDRDLKQIYIAKLLCVTQSQYSRLETADNELDYNGLRTLALFYNTSIDYILGMTNDITPPIRNEIKSLEDIKDLDDKN